MSASSVLQESTDRPEVPVVRRIAEAGRWSAIRGPAVPGCIWILSLVWALSAGVASAQDAVVEWLEFDCRSTRCLILNAYRHDDDAETGGDASRTPEPVSPDRIAPVFLTLPVTTVPDSSVWNPFCRLLGAPTLSALAISTPQLANEEASDLEVWRALVRAIQTREELQIGAVNVRSTEVSDDLKRFYGAQENIALEAAPFPHLVRGVLAVVDEDGHVVDEDWTVELGTIEYGTPQYAAVRLANIGREALHVPSQGGFFSGIRLMSADFSLLPGERISRLLRHEAGLVSLITGRRRLVVAYEADGRRRVALPLTWQASPPSGFLAEAGRAKLATHLGYWRELALYRFSLIVVALGAVALLVAARGRVISFAAAYARSLRRMFLFVPRILSRSGQIAARATSLAASLSHGPKRIVSRLSDLCLRAAPRLAAAAQRLKPPAGPRLDRAVSGVRGTVERAASAARSRLPVGWEFNGGHAPVSAQICVERIAQLSTQRGDSVPASLHATRVRRESIALARRLDDELRRGGLSPAIEHFQILWALRLLSELLARNNADPHDILNHWVQGAQEVLANGCPDGVGPTNSDFVELVRALGD